MWETSAALELPVGIHVADPVAFFRPTDASNERFEELYHHPDWSFHGRDFPRFQTLLAARDRLFARHPEDHVDRVSRRAIRQRISTPWGACSTAFPTCTWISRPGISELGRQPRAARAFFERYQDRILFGTDAVPNGHDTPQQIFGDRLYEIYYRFLETEDEYFDYAPAPVPPQGRWRIYGVGLPATILKKVYWDNAARLLGLEQ